MGTNANVGSWIYEQILQYDSLPSDDQSEQCGELVLEGYWRKSPCSELLRTVCEKDSLLIGSYTFQGSAADHTPYWASKEGTWFLRFSTACSGGPHWLLTDRPPNLTMELTSDSSDCHSY